MEFLVTSESTEKWKIIRGQVPKFRDEGGLHSRDILDRSHQMPKSLKIRDGLSLHRISDEFCAY